MERIDKVPGTFNRRPEEQKAVPTAVARRLPRYHRYLGELLREEKLRISSAELSEMMNVTASQIRQDFNYFGGFGHQGYGYNVKFLYGKISDLLGVGEGYHAVIVGAGNLGRALAATHMFERRGIKRIGLFDNDPELIGKEIYGLKVLSVDELGAFCKENHVEIAVLTVPKEAAYDVAVCLANAGVRGIWNFANMELHLDGCNIIVHNIHLGDSLLDLCYDIKTDSGKGTNDDGQF